MGLNLFKITSKNFLGVDIGTSTIKIVELSKKGEKVQLENYGEMSTLSLYQKPYRTFEKNVLLLSSYDISRAIQGVLEETKAKTNQATFTIPDYSTFYTNFEVPYMTEEELPQAVKYEARHHIPFPLSDVTIDWNIIGRGIPGRKSKVKILLVAVPNEVINQYREIAVLANLELRFLEAEVFSLARSLVGEDKRVIALVDIGAQSTTCSIIDKEVLRISHSFDIGSNELIRAVAQGLSIDYQEAGVLIKKYGVAQGGERNIDKILFPIIDTIFQEIKKISKSFYRTEGKEIQKIILAGGAAWLPGLKDYFLHQLTCPESEQYFLERVQKDIVIADPFRDIFYSPVLERSLKKMGPSFAIAIGAALRGFE